MPSMTSLGACTLVGCCVRLVGTNSDSSNWICSGTVSISPGRRTVRIGTDQSGALCYADILANDFRFTFKGRLIPLDQWNK